MIEQINKIRRYIANIIYVEKTWPYEARLSTNGVFDYALSTRSKRRIIQELSKTDNGKIKYNTDKAYPIDYLSYHCRLDEPYISDYIDEDKYTKDGEKINFEEYDRKTAKNREVENEAIHKYVLNHLLPELVECKVLKVEVENNETKEIIEDMDVLIDKEIYTRSKNTDKNNIVSSYCYNNEEYEITGFKLGKRFEYAFKALHAVYSIDSDHTYAPNYFN